MGTIFLNINYYIHAAIYYLVTKDHCWLLFFFGIKKNYSTAHLLLLLDRPLCPVGMIIVGWSSSSPTTEAKETLYSVPIELRFYSRPILVATLLVPTLSNAPHDFQVLPVAQSGSETPGSGAGRVGGGHAGIDWIPLETGGQ